MKRPALHTFYVTVALALVTPISARAQITPPEPEALKARGETVATRARPELEPLGVRAGSFLIFPKLSVDETFNDNVFATRHDTKDDFSTDVKPQLAVQSDWSNHALNFSTGADAGFYANYSRLDYTDWFVASDGRLDISRDAAFFGGGGFAQLHEDPGAPNAPADAKRPTDYDLINGFGRYVQQFGKFRALAEGTVVRNDYDKTDTFNAGHVSNTGRDYNTYTGGVQVGYDLSQSYGVFVRAEGNDVAYDQKEDAGGVERNAKGFTTVAGLGVDLGGLVFGDVYAGYLEQYFEDSQFDTLGAFTAGGTLTWNVTTLTTVNARAARIIEQTTQTGSPAVLRTTGGLSADHELLRNLILTAAATITNDDYVDSNANDNYYVAGVGARYLMNRNVYARLGYQLVRRSSSGSDNTNNSYLQNVVRIGLDAQL